MDQLSFGRRLRALRRQQALSQAELGGGELSASYISLLESGKRPPTDEVLLKLAARLGITPDELIGDTGIARPQSPLDAALESSYALSRARLALLTGDAQTALDRFAELGGDDTAAPALLADTLLGRAAALERLDRPAEAAALRGQWLDTFGSQNEDCVLRTEVLTGLLRCLRESGELRTAAARAEDALRDAESAGLAGTPTGLELAGVVAEYRWDLGQDDAAAELCERAAATAATLGGRREWALAYDTAAEAARAAGRGRHAAALAGRAVDACRDGAAGLPVARLRTAAAAVLARTGGAQDGSHADGQDHDLLAVREVLDEWGTPVDVAYGEVVQAGRLLAAGDAARALDLAGTAEKRVGTSWRRVRAHALLAQARAGWALGDRGSADRFEEAAVELAALGAERQAAGVHLELAELHEADGDVRAALACYRRASSVAGLLPSEQRDRHEQRDGMRS
ncbi:hypothetical protein C3486_04240 [Streptomyces sp. Ru73]|uniref:helix-turn-helix domain-containing protein n=1 Tax=Streptomyces sp. Ru73 TaxID=2080748 RepID=UPI000CDCE99A|nr:helix-turn-helix domain-containing protein [Streptomyces sp. Ru73]POX42503.1 hypothetical protein C3486_04240 [Streptomyces sp. Ru73]